jgi:hypothetical protein
LIYTCVFFETNRIEYEVDAASPEEAVTKGNAIRHENWDVTSEESLVTNGVEQVLDSDHAVVWPPEESECPTNISIARSSCSGKAT